LRQPSWSEWITPFTPDSLEAISWEARLPSSENFASGSFAVRNIRLFGKTTSTLGAPKRLATTFRLVRSSQQWTIERRGSQDQHTQLVLRNAHGQKLQSVSFAPGQSQQRLSQTLPSGILWVQVREGVHQWSQTLLVP
jgi:hypothetical protein